MIWLIALFSMLQTAPAPERPPEDRLLIQYPRAREAVRCANRLEPDQSVRVTLRCRVTDFGRATDCEPQGGVELSRQQADAVQCMAREMRFTNGDGGRPKPSPVEFTITLAHDQ